MDGGNGNGSGSKRIQATYDYTDASGKQLYQVVRFAPKNFRQRQPNGAGGWKWSLEGVKPVLYRLQEVMAAECVFVCEGEKDVDNLRGLGLTATCNSGGAGKWKPEYAEYLKGKSVIILPDNDSPGQQHGQEVARSLCGIAKSVKLVDLPGLPEKGDASDWIAARHKEGKNNDVIRDELLNLVDSAAEYRPIGESIETVYEAIDIEPAITPALNLDSVTVSTVFLIKK